METKGLWGLVSEVRQVVAGTNSSTNCMLPSSRDRIPIMRHTAIAALALFAIVPVGGEAGALPAGSAPRAVAVARTTEIPGCTLFVDAAATGSGTAQSPHKTIAAAVAAASNGAVICVAEGTYAEQIKPGEKSFTLAGGFQRGKDFKVRDSAAYVTKATGRGGSFIRIEDPGPKGNQLHRDRRLRHQRLFAGDRPRLLRVAAVRHHQQPHPRQQVRERQARRRRLCAEQRLGPDRRQCVQEQFLRPRRRRLRATTPRKENTVTIERNLVDNNHGTEPDASHGGALYVFGKTLRITGNLFTRNTVTQWGGGLYVGAWTEGEQFTTANAELERLSGQPRRQWRRRHVLRRRRDLHQLSRGLRPQLRRQHLSRQRSSDGPDHRAVRPPDQCRRARCRMQSAGRRASGSTAPAARPTTIPSSTRSSGATRRAWISSRPATRRAARSEVNVSHSMVQTKYLEPGPDGSRSATASWRRSIRCSPTRRTGDFHLKSTAGRWTPTGYVQDAGRRARRSARAIRWRGDRQSRARRQAQRARRLRQQRRGVVRPLSVPGVSAE